MYLVATTVVSGAGFLFHVIISRLLGPDQYSALGALLSLLAVIGVPLSAVQLSCARAQARDPERTHLGAAMRIVTLAGAGCALLLVAMGGAVRHFLHLPSLWPVLWLALWVLLAVVCTVPEGVLIGQTRFRVLSLALLAGAATRIALGVVLGHEHAGISGAMAATVGAQLATLAVTWHSLAPVRATGQPLRLTAADGLLTVGAMTGLAVFAAIDTLLARNGLPERESGYYAAASTAGRIALFATGAVSLLAFPRFVRRLQRGETARHELLVSLLAVTTLGAMVVGCLVLAPTSVVRVLFGREYLPAVAELVPLGVTGALLGCLTLITYHHLARGSHFALVSWVGAAAVLGAAAGLDLTRHNLALVTLVVVALTSAISLTWSLTQVTSTAFSPEAERAADPRCSREPPAVGAAPVAGA